MELIRRLAVAVGISLLCVAVRTSAAQNIVIPGVVPTAADDSLYRLAVDPATHDDEPTHVLSDSASIRVEGDGTVVKTFRRVIQVITDAGATKMREQQFGYVPGHQSFVVSWLRVVRPDGTVVSAAPTQVQESDVPAPISASPVYSDQKIVRVSLSGVTAGAIVDVKFTLTERTPAIVGDFEHSYVFTPGASIERARFVLDVPSSMRPGIREENLDFQRVTHKRAGRTTYIWARDTTPEIRIEPFASDSNDVVMRVRVSGSINWSDVSRWYAKLAHDRYQSTPRLGRIVDSLVAGAHTRGDSIRAVHHWVAQDIRYVGIELGIGGYQPRMPDTVIATGFGDCKDKATLFIAALNHLGIKAYPVLLSSNGSAKRDLASPHQFNHEIAAVPLGNGAYQFVDLTASYNAYGELPLNIQGGFGLVIFPDGKNEEVTIPVDSPASNVQTISLIGDLSPDGIFNGYYEETASGSIAAGMRATFASQRDSAQRAVAATRIARKYFASGEGDSLSSFDGRNFSEKPQVHIRIRDAKATTTAGPVMLLSNPFSQMTAMAGIADDIARMPGRRFPIDASKVLGQRTAVTELRVTLPEGWHAQLPPGVTATSVFGKYATTYSQTGDTVLIRRKLVGATGVFMPSRVNELIAWLRTIGSDDAKLFVLDKPASQATGKSGRDVTAAPSSRSGATKLKLSRASLPVAP
jgi:transglutaminase-like putative cysteine protease